MQSNWEVPAAAIPKDHVIWRGKYRSLATNIPPFVGEQFSHSSLRELICSPRAHAHGNKQARMIQGFNGTPAKRHRGRLSPIPGTGVHATLPLIFEPLEDNDICNCSANVPRMFSAGESYEADGDMPVKRSQANLYPAPSARGLIQQPENAFSEAAHDNDCLDKNSKSKKLKFEEHGEYNPSRQILERFMARMPAKTSLCSSSRRNAADRPLPQDVSITLVDGSPRHYCRRKTSGSTMATIPEEEEEEEDDEFFNTS